MQQDATEDTRQDRNALLGICGDGVEQVFALILKVKKIIKESSVTYLKYKRLTNLGCHQIVIVLLAEDYITSQYFC